MTDTRPTPNEEPTTEDPPTFVVTTSNEWNAGWLSYVLGLDRPEDAWGADGWDTGQETRSLDAVRHVMETQRSIAAPQYVARRAEARATATPGLREAAEAFLDHVAGAATWPTPGIGCDANCKEADALRAALSASGETDR